MHDIKRGIDKQFAEKFIGSRLYDLYENNRCDLLLGVRNGYINLYYKCASVCKVSSRLSCEVAKKYLYGSGNYGINIYKTISIDELVSKFEHIKSVIDSENKLEKEGQHQLIHQNNSNPDSKWFCVDLEYVKQRINSGETRYGRFDIIAVQKDSPHRVALIELKYGISAIGGTSGIVKHATDYIRFINDNIFQNHMREEIFRIIESLNYLNACKFKINSTDDIASQPEFYFITLNNQNDDARKMMRRYVLKKEPGASSRTVEHECDIDITTDNRKGFTPVFLFSDRSVFNNEIDDIIESRLYSRGL